MIHDAAAIRWYENTLNSVHLLLGVDKRPQCKQIRTDAFSYNRLALKNALFAKRKKMGRASRGRTKNQTKWLYPWATERRYGAAIRSWLKPLQDYVHEYLKNNQDAILRGDSASLTNQDEIPGGSYRRLVKSLYGWHTTYFPPINESGTREVPPQVLMGLGRIAESANDFNSKQWDKSAKAELGVEFPVYEDWWPNTKQAWQEENYTLIQSLGSDYIKQVNRAAEMAVTGGLSPAELAKKIHKIDKTIKASRVNLIARDQIGKLNGQITQARMESVGLEMYEWSTAQDERVRDSHADLEGMICRWDDFSVYSEDGKTWKDRPSDWCPYHPGQDIQCRCTALSYWAELVEEVDREIDIEEGFITGSDDSPIMTNQKKTELQEGTPGHGRKTPLIESQLGIEQGKPATINQAKQDANTHFLSRPGYNKNCQRSIVAYELQRRGYRVTALPAPYHRANDPVKNGYECFIGNGRKLRMERASNGIDDFIKRLSRFGDGSRFAISQNWNNPRSNEGHTYIAEKVNGKIIFIDPQKNQSDVSHYMNNVRSTDGKLDLYFYRIDNAFLNPKIDFTGVVEPYIPKGNIDKADSFAVLSKEDKQMTKTDAKAILEKSDNLLSWTDDNGVTWHQQIGDLSYEYPDSFGFAVYPYSSKEPINPKYAFQYFVNKDTKEVVCADSPMVEEEFKQMGG
jgi:SPP1 gp7 family putative phage head morphogenesis protein